MKSLFQKCGLRSMNLVICTYMAIYTYIHQYNNVIKIIKTRIQSHKFYRLHLSIENTVYKGVGNIKCSYLIRYESVTEKKLIHFKIILKKYSHIFTVFTFDYPAITSPQDVELFVTSFFFTVIIFVAGVHCRLSHSLYFVGCPDTFVQSPTSSYFSYNISIIWQHLFYYVRSSK